jgi:hypothetical protein
MERRVLLSAMVALALTVGCTTAGAAPQAPPGPSPVPSPAAARVVLCPPAGPGEKPVKDTSASEIEVTVDSEALPGFSCLSIKKGVTSVTWLGGESVKQLLVVLKEQCSSYAGPKPTKKPADPVCAGDACTLEKLKHRKFPGEFCYSVVVVRDDGTVKSTDPKLIINP